MSRDDASDALAYAFYQKARRDAVSSMSVPDFAKAAGVRYFEKRNEDANESKFWSLAFTKSEKRPGGVALLVRWGRIGTEGGSKPFEFLTDDDCLRAAAVRTAQKQSAMLREQAREQVTQLLTMKQVAIPKANFGNVLGDLMGRLKAGSTVNDNTSEPDPYLPPPTDSAGFRVTSNGARVRNEDGWALDVRGRAVRPEEERLRTSAARALEEQIRSPRTAGPRASVPVEPRAFPVAPSAPRKEERLSGDRVIDFEE